MLTKAKSIGGMGFRDFELMNTSLLAKQAWRALENPNSIWVRTLKALYFPKEPFLMANRKNGSSWVWSSLIQGRDFLLKHALWLVGDGNTVDVWNHNWIGSGPLLGGSQPRGKLLVRNLMKTNERAWDFGKVKHYIPPHRVREVMCTPISWTNQEDQLIWPHNKQGTFTVNSGYFVAREHHFANMAGPSSSIYSNPALWKQVWGLPCRKR